VPKFFDGLDGHVKLILRTGIQRKTEKAEPFVEEKLS
jgi:hypothetical protein